MLPIHADVLVSFETALSSYRAQKTVELRCYYIGRLIRWAEKEQATVWDLKYQDLMRWLTRDVGPSAWTKRSAKTSVSVFYKWAVDTGHTSTNPARKLPSMRAPQGMPNPCPEDRLKRAFDRCTRREDVLMLLLAELQAMRCCEIACLHTADVQGELLRVTGKGNKVRMVPMSDLVAEFVRYFPAGYFFPSDRNPLGHMLPASVGRRVRWLLGDQKKVNAHSLRHKFAMDGYDRTGDLLALKDFMGHASVATTQIYAQASAQRLKSLVVGIPVSNDRSQAVKSLKAVV